MNASRPMAILLLLTLLATSFITMGVALPAGAVNHNPNPSGDLGGVPVSAEGLPVESAGVPAATGGQAVQQYLTSLYRWFLGFVGVAALFGLVMGGVLYMFAGAINTTTQAKKWITNAILGILLAASAWLLLKTINPELVAGFDIGTLIKNNLKDLPKRNAPASTPTQGSRSLPSDATLGYTAPGEGRHQS